MPGCLLTTCAALAILSAEPTQSTRFMTFNVRDLTLQKLDEIDEQEIGKNPQLLKAAEIIQRLRPDVLLISEIDFDYDRRNATLFQSRYLSLSQNGQEPIHFEHIFFETVNSGISTGKDLDNDGRFGGPGDNHGYGYFGQNGMVLYSRFPILHDQARTFQLFPWSKMPGNLMPDGSHGKPYYHGSDEVAMLRLSSTSHWDVPIQIGEQVIHVLCCHPTPPMFDGPEDSNGRRNFDEIRFWADYLSPGRDGYIRDDAGGEGGLPESESFIILGDLNAEPIKASVAYGIAAANVVLSLSRVQDPTPTSHGAAEEEGSGDPGQLERRTSHVGRFDYALPSRDLRVKQAGVFWPSSKDPLAVLVQGPDRSSDHRPVWVDIETSRGNLSGTIPTNLEE